MASKSIALLALTLIALLSMISLSGFAYAQLYPLKDLHIILKSYPQPHRVIKMIEKKFESHNEKEPLLIKKVEKANAAPIHKQPFRIRPFNITSVAEGSEKVVVPSPLQAYYVGSDPRKGTSTKGYWSWQDYPYWVPHTSPLVVTVMKNVEVGNYSGPITVTVNLTSLKGLSFSRILLRVNVVLNSSVPGRPAVQYDRPLWIWIDGVPAFIGTTTQRFNYTAIVDVTHLYNLIVGKIFNVTLNLYNCVLPSYGLTGVFYVTVELLLYPGPSPSNVPDVIIPLFTPTSGRFKGLAISVLYPHSSVEMKLSVPSGASRAVLILYAEGAAWDEFWYYWMPPDRYIYIYSDGKPIAIIQPFPYIYTGGLNPFLWRPQPAIRTLAFYPFIADLSGLLPMIVGNHTLTMKVVNALPRWYIFAALALYYKPLATGYEMVSYSVTEEPIVTQSANVLVGYINNSDAVYHYIKASYASLSATTIIHIGNYSVKAVTTMFNKIYELQSYDAEWIWDNLTMSQTWLYVTKYSYVLDKVYPPNVLPMILSYGTQEFKFSWRASLDIVYGFEIYNIQGNIEQASLEHPVYANFTMITIVTQSLTDVEQPYAFTYSERVYEGLVESASAMTGTIAFISPTGALITGLSWWYGDTVKKVYGNEFRAPGGYSLFGSKMINFERITHSHVYTQQPMYRVLSDFIIVEWY